MMLFLKNCSIFVAPISEKYQKTFNISPPSHLCYVDNSNDVRLTLEITA